MSTRVETLNDVSVGPQVRDPWADISANAWSSAAIIGGDRQLPVSSPLIGGEALIGGYARDLPRTTTDTPVTTLPYDTLPLGDTLGDAAGYCGSRGRRVYVPCTGFRPPTYYMPAPPRCYMITTPTCRIVLPTTSHGPFGLPPMASPYYLDGRPPYRPHVPFTPHSFHRPHSPHIPERFRAPLPAPREVADAPFTPTPVRSLAEERTALQTAMERVRGSMNPADYRRMQRDMTTLEGRGLPEAQVAGVYAQVTRLFNATTGTVDAPTRTRFGREILHSAAVPTDIFQRGPTCGVSSSEVMMMLRTPALGASVMAEIALTGRAPQLQLRAGHGLPAHEVRLDRADIPHLASADHAIQWALVNFEQQMRNPHMRYHVRRGAEGYLQDVTRPWTRAPYEGILPVHLARVNEFLTGGRRELSIIHFGRGRNPDMALVDTPTRLRETLLDAAAGRNNVRFPIQAWVHTEHEPWRTDSGRQPGAGGWHVVTILGYNPTTGRLDVDNTWTGDATRRSVPLDQMFRSMQPPEPVYTYRPPVYYYRPPVHTYRPPSHTYRPPSRYYR